MPFSDPIYVVEALCTAILVFFVGFTCLVLAQYLKLRGILTTLKDMLPTLKGIHNEVHQTNTGPLTVVTTDPLLHRTLPTTNESRRSVVQPERTE